MYHDVVADGQPSGLSGAGPSRYKVSWERFLEHLDRMEQVAAGPPSIVGEVPSGSASSAPWSLTFDDGGSSAVAVGEELIRRGWRAYFFVTTGLIGTGGFLDRDAVQELDQMTHVVGSHSVTHPERMASLAPQALFHEWRASVEALSELLGRDVRTASVPGGSYRKRVAVAAAQVGIETLFTSEPVRTARAVGTCLVIGRYGIRADTSAEAAAQAAAGSPGPWLREYARWNRRKPVKVLAGHHYERFRQAFLTALSKRSSE
jgi:peptidoglycan/xylan/chitin deacetylase (PgdA/CDA1 family)